MKCKPYSEITVEIRTQLKTVKITSNIFAVQMNYPPICHQLFKIFIINKCAYRPNGSRRLIPIITRIMNHAQYHNEVQKLKVTALPLQAFSWKRIGIRKLIKLSKHANLKSYQLCRQGSKAQHNIKPQCALLVILFHIKPLYILS